MLAFEPSNAAVRGGTYPPIFHALDIGLVRINLEGYLLEVNQPFATLLSEPADALIGRHLADMAHPEDLAVALAHMDAALTSASQPFELLPRMLRADGRETPVRIQGTLLRDADGTPLQFLGVAQPAVTAAGPAASSCAPTIPPVGFDVIAGMGHALRTPLNAILGFAQLLRVDPTQSLSEAQQDKIGHIERSGSQLLALLSDVIDLARIEARRLPLQIEVLPVGPVLDEALSSVAASAEQAGVLLRAQLRSPTPDDEALCVWADRERLRQVLRKLLQHALSKPVHGGQILLEAQVLNHQVAITVSDTLHALSAAQQAELFGHPSVERGTGTTDGAHLSLHIVKRLVELMQGRIEVASATGMGTRLHIWLPQGQTTQAHREEPPPPVSAFADLDGEPGEQALTVLYAEDNVVNIELVRQVMRMRPQWRLEVAYCGQDAIAMAMRDPPDLLLLDMHLGDMSGLDVSNVLARQAYTADIPRVALSADVLPDHIREARSQGFADYLTKPLDVERLLRLLDRVAQRKAA
jgi:PAS domain S-box-containing protein